MSDPSLNDDELNELLAGPKVPVMVSMLSPLDVYIDTATLRQLVRESLDQLEGSRGNSDLETVAIEYAIQQRVDFLAWLHARQEEAVFMSMYPADADLGDDRLDEFLDRLEDS